MVAEVLGSPRLGLSDTGPLPSAQGRPLDRRRGATPAAAVGVPSGSRTSDQPVFPGMVYSPQDAVTFVESQFRRGYNRVYLMRPSLSIGTRLLSMLMPPEVIEDTEAIRGCIRGAEKVDHDQTKRRRKDGTTLDVSLTVSPIRDCSGGTIGASKIGRDITAEKRARSLVRLAFKKFFRKFYVSF